VHDLRLLQTLAALASGVMKEGSRVFSYWLIDCVNFAVGRFKNSWCVYVHVGRVLVLISFGCQLSLCLAFNEFTGAHNAWLLGKYLAAGVPLCSQDKGDALVVPGREVPLKALGAPRVFSDIML